MLDVVGCCIVPLLEVDGCCSATVGQLLDVVGCCWMLLDVVFSATVGCCRMLLDVVVPLLDVV